MAIRPLSIQGGSLCAIIAIATVIARQGPGLEKLRPKRKEKSTIVDSHNTYQDRGVNSPNSAQELVIPAPGATKDVV